MPIIALGVKFSRKEKYRVRQEKAKFVGQIIPTAIIELISCLQIEKTVNH